MSSQTTKRRKVFPVDLKLASIIVGEVFVVGCGDCGQLGLGPDITEKNRPGRLDYFADKHIVHVYVGGMHNVALSLSGKLYSWGCNDQFALGRPTGAIVTDTIGDEMLPAPVEGLDDEFIVDVACGDSATAALTKDGRNNQGIFGMKGAEKTSIIHPTIVSGLKNVVSIASGSNHMVAVTLEGKIYTWGVGEQGQLGRKIVGRYSDDSSLTPRAINFRPYKMTAKFVKAFCGSYHTFVKHESGTLFAFGLNNYGQLGIGEDCDDQYTHVPMRLALEEDETVCSAAGGEHHSLVLTESGKGDSSQTGFKDKASRNTPEELIGSSAIQVNCGSAFSLAVMKNDGSGNNLMVWGFGEQGQLARSDAEDVLEPETVELKGRVVLSAEAGGQHTVFLIAPK